MLALARHLGIDRFSAVGISGGAPHALACGARIPERIHRIGIASGFGPIDTPGSRTGMATQRKLGAFAARYLRFLVRPLMWAFRNPARNPELFVERFTSGFPGSDTMARHVASSLPRCAPRYFRATLGRDRRYPDRVEARRDASGS